LIDCTKLVWPAKISRLMIIGPLAKMFKEESTHVDFYVVSRFCFS